MMKKLTYLCILLIALGSLSSAFGQNGRDSNLRKVFKAIPGEIFSIACCDGNADEFIKKYVTVEDTVNGYMEGADTYEDPQYSSFEMTLFKRGEGSYIVGLHSESIHWSDYYFLDYRNGTIKNISKTIPQYSLQNVYEFPRKGTTIHVYKKKYDHPRQPLGADNTVTKGIKLYDLLWQNGAFVVKK